MCLFGTKKKFRVWKFDDVSKKVSERHRGKTD